MHGKAWERDDFRDLGRAFLLAVRALSLVYWRSATEALLDRAWSADVNKCHNYRLSVNVRSAAALLKARSH